MIDRLSELEAEISRVRSELDRGSRLSTIGAITAGVAHEINNQLTPALAYARLARSRPVEDETIRKALDRSVEGMEAASQILGAILDFSAGADEEAQADVAEVLQAAADCLGWDPDRGRITLVRAIEPGCVAPIAPLPLQQTLLNLLLNARRALGRSGGRVTVTAESQPDGSTCICVVDDGPGIPVEVATTLFEPFVTFPTPRNAGVADGRGGRGLGLAVCRRMIEAAGGTIAVEPTPGGGATFRIELPPRTHGAQSTD